MKRPSKGNRQILLLATWLISISPPPAVASGQPFDLAHVKGIEQFPQGRRI